MTVRPLAGAARPQKEQTTDTEARDEPRKHRRVKQTHTPDTNGTIPLPTVWNRQNFRDKCQISGLPGIRSDYKGARELSG